jgi:spermidine/putrescine transport system permease protein
MTRLRLLLAPALAAILIFMALPIALTTLCSVLTPAQYGGVIWEPSAEAYVRLLFERDIFDEALTFNANYLQFLARSVLQAGIATVLCLIVGVPTAWFIATRSAGQKPLWLMLVTVPCWVNLPVRTIALLLILRDEGPFNKALQSIGLTDGPLPLACNNLAIGLGLVSSFLSFMILPLYAAIERFDFPLLEAAYDLHANRRKVFFAVVLPILRPGLIAGGLLVFIPGIGSYLAPDILGGGRTLMLGNPIGLQFQGSRNSPFGAGLSTILMAVTLIALFAIARRASRGAA